MEKKKPNKLSKVLTKILRRKKSVPDESDSSTIKAESPLIIDQKKFSSIEEITLESESFESIKLFKRERNQTIISIHSVDDTRVINLELDQPCLVDGWKPMNVRKKNIIKILKIFNFLAWYRKFSLYTSHNW